MTAVAVPVLASLLLAAPRDAAAQGDTAIRYRDPVFDRVDSTTDVAYGSAVDIPSGSDFELLLDIYEPHADTALERPVFVFVHGGGFTAGDKATGRAYCNEMARRGYVAVSIGYRLNQGNIWIEGIPAATADARQAVRWLLQREAEYRLDTGRITMGGSSAGAITSLFVAYTDVSKGATDPSGAGGGVAAVMDLWGGLYTEVDEMASGDPPLIIVHGTEDTVVPFGEAERLRARAVEVGVPHAWHPVQGAAHAPWDPTTFMAWTAEFFYAQLWPDPSSTPPATATDVPSATPTRDPNATPATTPTSDPNATPTRDPNATPVATATSTRVSPSLPLPLYLPRAMR
ncbi:MAG: alpha/beta hydrolase fold domain-containing protein [Anaerolineae bacterium]